MAIKLRRRPHAPAAPARAPTKRKRARPTPLYEKWSEAARENVRDGSWSAYKRNVREMVREFAAVPVDGVKRPRVGIVGEILVKYHANANEHLVDLIESEGGEAVVPDMANFLSYCMFDTIYSNKKLGGPLLPRLGGRDSRLAARERAKAPIAEAIRGTRFGEAHGIKELAKLGSSIVSQSNQGGEGWLLSAEMISLIESGVKNVLCVQPFACLPKPHHRQGRSQRAETPLRGREHPPARLRRKRQHHEPAQQDKAPHGDRESIKKQFHTGGALSSPGKPPPFYLRRLQNRSAAPLHSSALKAARSLSPFHLPFASRAASRIISPSTQKLRKTSERGRAVMDYAAFVSYVLLMVFAPGANTITAMSGASRGGFMGAMPFCAGLFLGTFVIECAAALFCSFLYGFIPQIRPAMDAPVRRLHSVDCVERLALGRRARARRRRRVPRRNSDAVPQRRRHPLRRHILLSLHTPPSRRRARHSLLRLCDSRSRLRQRLLLGRLRRRARKILPLPPPYAQRRDGPPPGMVRPLAAGGPRALKADVKRFFMLY